MTRLEEILNKITRVDQDDLFIKATADRGFSNFVLDKIRIDQLFNQGINEGGKIIGFYAPATEARNPEKKAGTPFTLRDTEAFYDSFSLDSDEEGIEIDADGKKEGDYDLVSDFGEEILGLTDENLEAVKEVIKENIKKEFLRDIGLL